MRNPVFDFIQNKDSTILFCQLANEFQETRLWIERAAIPLARLSDDCCNLLAVRLHHSLKAFKIVERQGDDVLTPLTLGMPELAATGMGLRRLPYDSAGAYVDHNGWSWIP